MTNWTDTPQFQTTARLNSLSPEQRADLRLGPFEKARHEALFDALPLLRQIEVAGAMPKRDSVNGAAKVLFWNVERLRHVNAITRILQTHAPDVMLLCEIDRGMARSGNSDRMVDLASALDVSYAFAVEFIELDLGDVHEKRTHAGEVNLEGLHGAAVLSDVTLAKPFLIRIDRRGDWFGEAREEPRIGGTIAIGAQVLVGQVPVLVVSVHLESHDDPAGRAADMLRLLEQVETLSKGGAVVLGGDFNTSTSVRDERLANPAAWRNAVAADPMRPLRPQPFEPLFGHAEKFGYDWAACNVPDLPTTRHPAGSPRFPAKIDWFFTRGVLASDPAVLPAVDSQGQIVSDHEALIVTITPLASA